MIYTTSPLRRPRRPRDVTSSLHNSAMQRPALHD
jgi:hypothetical protein